MGNVVVFEGGINTFVKREASCIGDYLLNTEANLITLFTLLRRYFRWCCTRI